MAQPDPETDGRLLALRKGLAKLLSRMSPEAAEEVLTSALLPVGEEDPGVLATELDEVSAAMGREMAALLAEADRLRKGYD